MQAGTRLDSYLRRHGARFEVDFHPETVTAQETAAIEHIRGKNFVKVVMVTVGGQLAMVCLPAHHRLDTSSLSWMTGGKPVQLCREEEFIDVFDDCETGAMPPFGNLYHVPVYMDVALADDEFLVFNAGTHRRVVRMARKDYERLVQPRKGTFSERIH